MRTGHFLRDCRDREGPIQIEYVPPSWALLVPCLPTSGPFDALMPIMPAFFRRDWSMVVEVGPRRVELQRSFSR
jgi:hypothetical protein